VSHSTSAPFETPPGRVHDALRKMMLVDGYEFVFDPERSSGSTLVDAATGKPFLDLFSFFASLPISFNHPDLDDPVFREKLAVAALHRPTNSDVYTTALADFVSAFSRTLPKEFTHLFFIDGGALAVENTLKVAFDWKVQKNLRRGVPESLGTRVAHFQNAFHGRSGYTLSLTNTADPRKTKWFPKFDWPRLPTPRLSFPTTDRVLQETKKVEDLSIDRLKEALAKHRFDVAAVIVEPIQGEGGDNHLRPEFLKRLRDLCDEEEMLLIFDEVQTGFGLTGTWWCFEQLGVVPDVFAFGKKTQQCGLAATSRVDDVDSVFKVPSRINSTWGGNLVDMTRSTRYIEIIEKRDLLRNAKIVGAHLLERLAELATRFPKLVSNARGRGLMCAFDLVDAATRDRLKDALEDDAVVVLPCGERSIRFRPVLDFTKAAADDACERIASALTRISS
jgi:L-lysine 6-transaminase